jgi:hypothetical protein
MSKLQDALLADIIDTAIQQYSVKAEAGGKEPIFVERTSSNVLTVRQRDKDGLSMVYRVQITAQAPDSAVQYVLANAA